MGKKTFFWAAILFCMVCVPVYAQANDIVIPGEFDTVLVVEGCKDPSSFRFATFISGVMAYSKSNKPTHEYDSTCVGFQEYMTSQGLTMVGGGISSQGKIVLFGKRMKKNSK
jgi:hypothetical protein